MDMEETFADDLENELEDDKEIIRDIEEGAFQTAQNIKRASDYIHNQSNKENGKQMVDAEDTKDMPQDSLSNDTNENDDFRFNQELDDFGNGLQNPDKIKKHNENYTNVFNTASNGAQNAGKIGTATAEGGVAAGGGAAAASSASAATTSGTVAATEGAAVAGSGAVATAEGAAVVAAPETAGLSLIVLGIVEIGKKLQEFDKELNTIGNNEEEDNKKNFNTLAIILFVLFLFIAGFGYSVSMTSGTSSSMSQKESYDEGFHFFNFSHFFNYFKNSDETDMEQFSKFCQSFVDFFKDIIHNKVYNGSTSDTVYEHMEEIYDGYVAMYPNCTIDKTASFQIYNHLDYLFENINYAEILAVFSQDPQWSHDMFEDSSFRSHMLKVENLRKWYNVRHTLCKLREEPIYDSKGNQTGTKTIYYVKFVFYRYTLRNVYSLTPTPVTPEENHLIWNGIDNYTEEDFDTKDPYQFKSTMPLHEYLIRAYSPDVDYEFNGRTALDGAWTLNQQNNQNYESLSTQFFPNLNDDLYQAVDTSLEMLDYAMSLLGNPYVWGGNSLENGSDCSHFVNLLYKKFGLDYDFATSNNIAYDSHFSKNQSIDAQPGDLICYQGHVAMVVSVDKAAGTVRTVEAWCSDKGVVSRVTSIDKWAYSLHYSGAENVLKPSTSTGNYAKKNPGYKPNYSQNFVKKNVTPTGNTVHIPAPGESITGRDINQNTTHTVTRMAKDSYTIEMTASYTRSHYPTLASRMDIVESHSESNNEGNYGELLTVTAGGENYYVCAIIDNMYSTGQTYQVNLNDGSSFKIVAIDAKSSNDPVGSGATNQADTEYGHGYFNSSHSSVQMNIVEFFDAGGSRMDDDATKYSNQPNIAGGTYVTSVTPLGNITEFK